MNKKGLSRLDDGQTKEVNLMTTQNHQSEVLAPYPNLLSTEEELQLEVRKKVGNQLKSRKQLGDNENALDYIVRQYLDVLQLTDMANPTEMDKDVLNGMIKLETLRLKALAMMREDIGLKKKQDIKVTITRESLDRSRLSI